MLGQANELMTCNSHDLLYFPYVGWFKMIRHIEQNWLPLIIWTTGGGWVGGGVGGSQWLI